MIQSGFFIDGDDKVPSAENCARKLGLFLLLASDCDFKTKLECWASELEGDSVPKKTAQTFLADVFNLSLDLLQHLQKINIVDAKSSSDWTFKDLRKFAEKKAEEVVNIIF